MVTLPWSSGHHPDRPPKLVWGEKQEFMFQNYCLTSQMYKPEAKGCRWLRTVGGGGHPVARVGSGKGSSGQG